MKLNIFKYLTALLIAFIPAFAFAEESKYQKLLNFIEIQNELGFGELYEKDFKNFSDLEKINLINKCSGCSNFKILKLIFKKNYDYASVPLELQPLNFLMNCNQLTTGYLEVFFSNEKIQEELKKDIQKIVLKLIDLKNYFTLDFLLRNNLIALSKDQAKYFCNYSLQSMSVYFNSKAVVTSNFNLEQCFTKVLANFYKLKDPDNLLEYKIILGLICEKLSRSGICEVLNSNAMMKAIAEYKIANSKNDPILLEIFNRDFEKLKVSINSTSRVFDSLVEYLMFAMLNDYEEGFNLILSVVEKKINQNTIENFEIAICKNNFLQDKYFDVIIKKIDPKNNYSKNFIQYSCLYCNYYICNYFSKNGITLNNFMIEEKTSLDFLMNYGTIALNQNNKIKKENFASILKLFKNEKTECKMNKELSPLYKLIIETLFTNVELKILELNDCFFEILNIKKGE